MAESGKRIFYVSNPDNDDGLSRTKAIHPPAHRPYQHQQLPYHHHRPSPSQPTNLDTDFLSPLNGTTASSYPPLSPDLTGSPPADQVTPPPTTPSLHSISSLQDIQSTSRLDNPPVKPLPIQDSSSYHDRSMNDLASPPPTSRKGHSANRFPTASKPPYGSRPITRPNDPSRRNIHTSPTAPPPDVLSPSNTPSTATPPEKLIFVTSNSESYLTLDISPARAGAQIRELILNKLNIYEDNDIHPFAIYQTEIGHFALGEALSNEQLWSLCRDHGDSRATLKFFVSAAAAPVHELTSQPPPQVAEMHTIPPVITQKTAIAPLQYNKRRSRSRNGSFSSQSDSIPAIEDGYEPDRDIPRREKPTPRSVVPPSVMSPPATSTGQAPHRRPSGPNHSTRSGSPLVADQSSTSPGERSWSQSRKEAHGAAYSAPQAPPPASPTTYSMHDDPTNWYTQHTRSGSDVVVEADLPVKAAATAEQPTDMIIKPSRPREIIEVGKVRHEQSRENFRGGQYRKAGDDDDWEHVSSNQQGWTGDDTDRSTSSLTRSTRQHAGKGPSSPYNRRPMGTSRGAPPVPAMAAAPSHPRNGRQPLPQGFLKFNGSDNNWNRRTKPANAALSSFPTGPTSGLKKSNTKSMNDLRLGSPTATSQASRPPHPSRPTGNIPYTPTPSNNPSLSGTPKSYELPRGSFNRPLPPNANTHDYAASYSTGTRGYPSTSSLMSPGIELYPRPSSAQGDAAMSPVHGSSRIQSPTLLDPPVMESSRSPRAPSPHRPFHALGPRPRPTNYSDRSDRSSDIQSGPETSNTTPPRTPISPQSQGSDHQNGFIVQPSSPSSVENPAENSPRDPTLKPDEHLRYEKVLRNGDVDYNRSQTQTGAATATAPPTSLPPPLAETRPFEEYDDDDSDNGGGTWIVRPGPKSPRPPLTVQIDSGSTTPSTSTMTVSRANRPPEVPAKDHLAPPSRAAARRPDSTFVDAADTDSWATRPLPENIYDHLEKFFPTHDLDKPVIEASSGDTSPTSLEPAGALPAPTPPATAISLASASTATVVPTATIIQAPPPVVEERGRIHRGKKSIRIVAQEHKKKIDRTSRASDSSYANMMRKRSTKLWGSKLEEVTTNQARNASSSPDSPSGGPTTFKWVRGELIGKGTYGRVYLALNATTGEMIAVKQVELPQTASDKADSKQHLVVQALKSESETLRDLDHPHVVQYLGFEETPTNLSIFLEYVPGGSVGSCLLKHGKFEDNVTRSFTGQILGGLEYLHSKGILHRDLKADNILVEMTGVCKISDFGISKRTEDIHGGAHTAMQGTVFWMAPEVINTQKSGYNNKIDIWSVGCVVLEMWAGMRPWNGEEMLAVMFKLYQSKQPPPVPEDVVLTPEADDFRTRCFAINPDERPSAAELRRHPYLTLPPDWIFNGFT